MNGDAFRIELASQGGRVAAAFDIGDLRGGERNHLIRRISAEKDVEIVKISSGGAHDDRSDGFHGLFSFLWLGGGGLIPAVNLMSEITWNRGPGSPAG